MKQILSFLRPYRKRMTIGFCIKVVATVFELLIPWALAVMIDTVVPMQNVTYIVLWGLLMVLFTVGALLTNAKANRMASLVARNTTERIRLNLFAKISFLSMEQQEEITMPSMISRATSDTYNIHQMLGMMQRLGVRQPIMLVGSLLITFTLDVPMTLVMVAMLPIMVLFTYFFTKKGIPLFTKVQQALDRFVRIVREDIAGIRVIKALSKTDTERERFGKVNREVVDQNFRAGMIMGAMNPVMTIILNLGMVLVIVAGAYRVNAGQAKPGTILAFMTYTTTILNSILFLSRMFVMYSKASASGKRIAEVLNMPSDLGIVKECAATKDFVGDLKEQTETDAQNLMEQNLIEERKRKGLIVFENVSFAYGNGENSLQDISFALKKGETLGIIGATGSGKSTIINLMMRFYDVNHGHIYIDGKDVRSYEIEDLRNFFGVAFQNDIIFRESIRENVDFGREIPDSEIRKALETAQAEFVEEKGLDFPLAIRGMNLSGGQKQRLLVARALAGEPEILILDDSSSALDYATDARLRASVKKNYPNTTMVIVAQRVSSIKAADKIIVMDDGEMIGYGTHEDLMESCDVYREISDSQMGGGENE